MTLLTHALALLLTQAGPAAGPRPNAPGPVAAAPAPAADEGGGEDIDPLYKLALSYLAAGDSKKAIAPLEQLLKKDAENIDARLMLARAFRGSGELQKAKDLLDKSILAAPDDPSLRAERGALARATEDNETAVLHYKKAVELAPTDPKLAYNLAEAMHASPRSRDDSVAMYKKALELDPGFTEAKVNLAKAYAEKGKFSDAKAMLTDATRDSRADAEAWYNLGVIMMRENNQVGAIEQFQQALKVNPRHAQALNNLGVALDAKGDAKKALE